MARYDHLKVFKDFYDLSKMCLNSIRQFPRIFKYTLGNEIQINIYKILKAIIIINSLRDRNKKNFFLEIITDVELLQIQLRLAKDMQCFNNLNIWINISNKVTEILKQLEGWKKASKKSNRVNKQENYIKTGEDLTRQLPFSRN